MNMKYTIAALLVFGIASAPAIAQEAGVAEAVKATETTKVTIVYFMFILFISVVSYLHAAWL